MYCFCTAGKISARGLSLFVECGFSPEIEERVRVFVLLQRWSGLACVDAATLPRNLLRADDALTQVHRTKTDAEVFPVTAGRSEDAPCTHQRPPRLLFLEPGQDGEAVSGLSVRGLGSSRLR